MQRDLALERLRRLTIACFVGAAGMVAVFAILASSSIPGHSSAASSTTGLGLGGSPSQDPNQDPNQNQGLIQQNQPQNQNPFSGFFGGGGGSPVAVSGGSHP